MLHFDLPNNQRVGDERSMTPLGQNLRAHDRRSVIFSYAEQVVNGHIELLSLHVVSETSKGKISPAHIGRVHSWMTQAAQLLHQDIVYSRLLEALRQDVLIELWVTPRARNCSDIDYSANAMSTKDAKEIL